MTTHASRNGYLHRVRRVVPDNAKVPSGAVWVGYARLVSPNGHYDGAPTCTLYFVPGEGYIAACVRLHQKT